MLSFKLKPLNFKAISGNSAISKYEKNRVKISNIMLLEIKLFTNSLSFSYIQINGIVKKNKVLAGVGRPIKELDCLLSILNLASLNPENIVKIKPENGK